MKTLSATALIISVMVHCTAQTINVYYKGQSQEHKVNATFSDGIITDKGTVINSQIDSIRILTPGPYSKALQARYGTNWKATEPIPAPDHAITGFNTSMLKFREQRATGKIFQLLGAASLSAGVFVIMHRANKAIDDPSVSLDKPKKYPIGLVIGGGAAMIAGFTIDIGAGKHLPKSLLHF